MPQVLAFVAPTVFGAGGSVALFTAAGGLTVAGTVASLAGSLALNAVARSLQPGAPGVSPESLKVATAQDVADRVVHFGRVRVGYALGFINARSGVLHQIVIHAHGQIDGIEGYRIDRNPVTLDADGYVQDAQYLQDGAPLVRILSKLGAADQAYLAELGADYLEWTPEHRLAGLAYSMMRAELPPASEWTRVYPDREPRLEVVARGALLRDPRDGGVRWSENAALCALAYEESPDGGGLAGHLDDASFAAAADICDQSVPLAGGGTEARYRFAGSYSLQEEPAEVRNRLLGAMAGQYWITPGGKLGLRAGAYEPPRFTITDDMVAGIEWTGGLDAVQGYNVQRFEYIDPALQFSRVAGDPWVNADSVAAHGARAIDPFISAPSHRQCRAVCKIQDMLENPAQRISLRCKPVALLALYDATVALNVQEIGLGGVWRIASYSVDPLSLAVTYELAQIDAGAYQLALDEQGTAPSFSDIADSDGIPAPVGFNAAPQGVEVAAGSFVAGIGVAWQARPYASLAPLLEYRRGTSGAWQSVEVDPAATSAQITGLEQGVGYGVRLRWQAPGEATGPAAQEDGVQALSVTGAPVAPTGLQVTQGSAGVALVSWTASASVGHYASEVYRDGVLVASIVSERSTPQTVNDLCGAGSFSWTVRAVNVAGAVSPDTAAVAATIT